MWEEAAVCLFSYGDAKLLGKQDSPCLLLPDLGLCVFRVGEWWWFAGDLAVIHELLCRGQGASQASWLDQCGSCDFKHVS